MLSYQQSIEVPNSSLFGKYEMIPNEYDQYVRVIHDSSN